MSGHAYSAGSVPRGQSGAPAKRPPVAGALFAAGACLIALVLIWVVAELVPAARVRDAATLHDFTLLRGPHLSAVANFLLDLLDPLALFLGRARVALAVAVVMALAPLTSDVLKPLLAHPHARVGAIHIAPASWPSGHATAALALALCAVLVSPARLRPAVAALGGVFSAAVGCALLILAWHMPSDVLGGYVMAALWAALAVAALRAADRRWPHARSRRRADRRGPLGRSRSGAPRLRGRAVSARLPQELRPVATVGLGVGGAAGDEQEV
jgi:membrane-associated phospholipid phosphatase